MDGDSDASSVPEEFQDQDPDSEQKSVKNFWKFYTIKKAIDNLMVAWKDITVSTIQHGWKKLLPHLYQEEAPPPSQTLATSMSEAVAAAREIPGFEAVDEEEVSELHCDTSNTEDIMATIALEDDLQEERQAQGREEGPEEGVLSMAKMSAILAAAEYFKEVVVANEVCAVRSNEVIQSVKKAVAFYSETHAKKMSERKQSLITRYLSSVQEVASDSDNDNDESENVSIPESMFNESVVDDTDFDGFMASLATAGPSTSGGTSSQ